MCSQDMNTQLTCLVISVVTSRPTSLLVTNSVSVFLCTLCMFLPIKVTAAYMIFDWIQYEVAGLKKSSGK